MFNVILKQYYAGVTHPDHTCICCYNERLFEFYRLCYHKQLVSANSFFFKLKTIYDALVRLTGDTKIAIDLRCIKCCFENIS